MDIIKISVIGLAGVLLGLLMRQARAEYAQYISLAVGLFILTWAVFKMQAVFDFLAEIQELIPVDARYVRMILKMIGITYIGQFASGICRDAGCTSIAGQIEIFGKLSIMAISMPILLALLKTINGFLT